MKPLRSFFLSGVALLFVIGACAPQPQTQPAPPAAQDSAVPQPSLVPVNLAGPEMKIGSTWLYGDGTLLVPVPAGIFTMGHGGLDNPVHQVNLPDFWIYRTKVTNAQYAYCVAMGGCTPPDKQDNPAYFNDLLHDSDPVVGVDYSQASTYCGWVHARLPTEAEWEKTARGPDANIYPWGMGAPNCDLLNYETCQGNTTPVNTYPQGQSYYRAFDMEGNAFEWAADWYKADYYLNAPADSPLGPAKGTARSVRSSAFNSGANQTPAYTRFFYNPAYHKNNLGFRCVVEDPAYFAPFCNYPATYGTEGAGGEVSGPQSTVDCPALSITQGTSCEGTQSITYVGLSGPPGSIISVPQPPCTAQNNGPYICTGDGAVSICSECKVTTVSEPQCPEGYDYVDTSRFKGCRPKFSGGQCLPGYTIESLRRTIDTGATPAAPGADQCCSFTGSPGLTTGGDLVRGNPSFPACPPGTNYDGQECVSVSVQSPYCKKQSIDLKDCSANTCAPPPGGCGINYAWDKDSCACVCNGC